MATEKLKFKIELYSVYYNKPPIPEILIKNTDDKSDFNNSEIMIQKQVPLYEMVPFNQIVSGKNICDHCVFNM